MASHWHAHRHQHVVWIGGDPPHDDEARVIRDAITTGDTRFDAVARRVAATLIEHDLASVGPLADLGIFRSWYLAGARRLLERVSGRLVRFEDAPPVEARPAQEARA